MREKTDKFQQRRLDGFFKAGVKACDEACAAEEPEPDQPEMPEVAAMEVEMEVCACSWSLCTRALPHQMIMWQGSLFTCLDART